MKKIGFGIIGAGLWGANHAEVYAEHPYVKLIGVCDLVEDKARTLAEKYGVRTYSDYRKMLADPEVDAVAVVTPDFAHADPIIAASEAEKHIIIEKPLATTIEDIERIMEALRRDEFKRSRCYVMVDFHNRWNPTIAQTKKSIEEGKLGQILSAYYRLNDRLSVPTNMLSWAAKSSILWFLGSHTVDTLRYLFDDEVERVYSVSRSVVLKERGIDVPDFYQSILEFNSGIVATIENSWIIPNTNPNINDIKVNVTGSKGMIQMDLTNSGLIERFTESGADNPDCLVMPEVFGKHRGFAHESIRDFIEAIVLDKELPVTIEDGVNTSKVILALFESAEKRMPVEVEY